MTQGCLSGRMGSVHADGYVSWRAVLTKRRSYEHHNVEEPAILLGGAFIVHDEAEESGGVTKVVAPKA